MNVQIVVLGGGFAGVSTAQELAKQLRKSGRLTRGARDDGVAVTLINRENYFVFQPLLADIISGAIETTHVVVPLRRMLRDVEVEVGNVEVIDPERRRVTVRRRQSGQTFEVEYDALVIALGSVTDFRAVPGMAEHALGVRTLGDAFFLRNKALATLEEAANEPDADRRAALLTFVVVGGGSTGVEVAAELEDLLSTAQKTFATLPPPEVVLVHSRDYVLPEFGERLGRYATRKLAKAGVRLVLGRRLTRVEADRVELDDGGVIPTATVVSTVGNAPNPILAHLDGAVDARGWLTPDAWWRWISGDRRPPAPSVSNGSAIRGAQNAEIDSPAVLDTRPTRYFRGMTTG